VTQPLNTIWLDLTRAKKGGEVPRPVAQACEVEHARDFESAQRLVTQRNPDWLVVEFDYPNSSLLRRSKAFNQSNASTPMVVCTVQHSEALAVWALRSKFLDYLVKPVPEQELDYCLQAIRAIREAKKAGDRQPIIFIENTLPPETTVSRPDEKEALRRAVSYVEQSYHKDMRNEAVAQVCGMNPFNFSRLFKKTYGIGFREFLTRFRLREARRLLANPHANVTQVGFSVGFNDPSYFSRVFKKYYGQNPSAYLGKLVDDIYPDVIDEDYPPCPIVRRK
jgi:YesN/AraC family two-component response regulator